MKIIDQVILITFFSLINCVEVLHEEFIHHAEQREFYVHLPETYESLYKDFPVIIMIHGWGQTSQAIFENTKFHKLATKKGYIVVGAEKGKDNKAPTWNFGSNDNHFTEGRNVDDSNYFRRMIQILTEKYKVNPDMIFVTGWNTGAHMVYRLACELSDKIAGAVPSHGMFGHKNVMSCLDASTQVTPFQIGPFEIGGFSYNQQTCPYEIWKNTLPEFFQCNQVKEVPIMVIQGLRDPFFHENGVWFDGVEGWGQDNVNYHWYAPPMDYGPRYFLEKYKCDPNDVEKSYSKVGRHNIDENDISRCFTSKQTKRNPKCQTEFTQCFVSGGAQWFGMDRATFKEQEKVFQASLGPQTLTFNSNKEIIKFFDRVMTKIGEKELNSDL